MHGQVDTARPGRTAADGERDSFCASFIPVRDNRVQPLIAGRDAIADAFMQRQLGVSIGRDIAVRRAFPVDAAELFVGRGDIGRASCRESG